MARPSSPVARSSSAGITVEVTRPAASSSPAPTIGSTRAGTPLAGRGGAVKRRSRLALVTTDSDDSGPGAAGFTLGSATNQSSVAVQFSPRSIAIRICSASVNCSRGVEFNFRMRARSWRAVGTSRRPPAATRTTACATSTAMTPSAPGTRLPRRSLMSAIAPSARAHAMTDASPLSSPAVGGGSGSGRRRVRARSRGRTS